MILLPGRQDCDFVYTIVPDSYQNNTKKGADTVTIKGLGDYGGTKAVKYCKGYIQSVPRQEKTGMV